MSSASEAEIQPILIVSASPLSRFKALTTLLLGGSGPGGTRARADVDQEWRQSPHHREGSGDSQGSAGDRHYGNFPRHASPNGVAEFLYLLAPVARSIPLPGPPARDSGTGKAFAPDARVQTARWDGAPEGVLAGRSERTNSVHTHSAYDYPMCDRSLNSHCHSRTYALLAKTGSRSCYRSTSRGMAAMSSGIRHL